jgi:hypothetical protein
MLAERRLILLSNVACIGIKRGGRSGLEGNELISSRRCSLNLVSPRIKSGGGSSTSTASLETERLQTAAKVSRARPLPEQSLICCPQSRNRPIADTARQEYPPQSMSEPALVCEESSFCCSVVCLEWWDVGACEDMAGQLAAFNCHQTNIYIRFSGLPLGLASPSNASFTHRSDHLSTSSLRVLQASASASDPLSSLHCLPTCGRNMILHASGRVCQVHTRELGDDSACPNAEAGRTQPCACADDLVVMF